MSRIHRCFVAIAVISLSTVFLGSGIVEAGLGAGATPSFPAVVTVGATGVAAAIQVENDNTLPNTASTVCNFGDAFPCPLGDPGITLIPSCSQLGVFSACAPTGADPGVFQVSPTGIGAAGTACDGMTFAITVIDQVFGQLRFTPQPVGTHVVLPVTGALCQINFTFDVLKSPGVDQNPNLPGAQTVQVVDNTQHDSGEISASGRGTSSGTTVLRATPSIATTASATITLGGQLIDSIVVSGLVNPQPGATVDSRLYGPDDATCSGAPVFESVVGYPVSGGPLTTAAFTPTRAGVYRWVAAYSGDVNNAPVSGTCNDTSESVTVSPAAPSITTTTVVSVTIGGQLTDVAIVSGRVNPQPGATVTMRAYGPDDSICSGVPVFESTVPYPDTGGPVTSAPFTPATIGVYRWIAVYSGDINNTAVSGVCNDVNETATVLAAPLVPVPPFVGVVSQAPLPGPGPALPATGSGHTVAYLASSLIVTLLGIGCILVGSTQPRRRRRGSAATETR